MNRLIISVFIFLSFILSDISAQDTTKLPLQKGKFALQYLVSGWNLYAFQGSLISFKYHILDKSAIRFGATVSGSSTFENKINNLDTTKNSSYSFDLILQYVQYVITSDDICLYVGSGPHYSRSYYKYGIPLSSTENHWSIGISGLIGTEWFFRHNMSLSGEYGLLILYNVSESIDDRYGKTYYSKNVTTMSPYQFKFGLSVYL